jgi:transketolase C-terminal domain/subunit
VLAGTELLYLATGSIAGVALQAAQRLRGQGLRPAMAVLAHLPHRPSPPLIELLSCYRAVVTVEEGFIAGGLGALAAQAIAEQGLEARLSMRGVQQRDMGVSGEAEFLRARAGLEPQRLAAVGCELWHAAQQRTASSATRRAA